MIKQLYFNITIQVNVQVYFKSGLVVGNIQSEITVGQFKLAFGIDQPDIGFACSGLPSLKKGGPEINTTAVSPTRNEPPTPLDL